MTIMDIQNYQQHFTDIALCPTQQILRRESGIVLAMLGEITVNVQFKGAKNFASNHSGNEYFG